jgi:hypothetical protein
METNPVSGTLCSLVSRIPNDGQVQKPTNPECYTPSSEPCRTNSTQHEQILIKSDIREFYKPLSKHSCFGYNGRQQGITSNEDPVRTSVVTRAKLTKYMYILRQKVFQNKSCREKLNICVMPNTRFSLSHTNFNTVKLERDITARIHRLTCSDQGIMNML